MREKGRALSTVKTRERLALLIVLSTQTTGEFRKFGIIGVFGKICGYLKACLNYLDCRQARPLRFFKGALK